ncbi:unnamed protein product [Prunus brigantina]
MKKEQYHRSCCLKMLLPICCYFINVVKIIYKEFKDMKEQETLNQEALQQEQEQEDDLEVNQVWKKSNPKFTSIEIEIEWVQLMAIGWLVEYEDIKSNGFNSWLVEYEDIVAVQKRKQYVSLAAVEAEVVAVRNAISLSQRKSGRYCSVVNWLNTNANDSSNWSAMEGIKFHALRLWRLISHSLCHLFYWIPKNEQITEGLSAFLTGQENNDMVVSARMMRLYKLACSEIEEDIKESPMKNTFSTTTIVDAISKVLDGFFHLILRLEALVSSPLLLVSKTIHHHVSSLEVFLDICEKDATNLHFVGLNMELHIEDEWRE